MVTPFASIVESITPSSVAAQIANVHTIFNIVTTILLLPVGKQLVKLAYIILPEQEEQEEKMTLKYLDFDVFHNDYRIGTNAITNTQLFNEVQNMLQVTINNVKRAFDLITEFNEETYHQFIKEEEYINYLNKEIVRYTTYALSLETDKETRGLFIKMTSNLERVGDHAVSIAARAKRMYEEGSRFSKEAIEEVNIMKDLSKNILEELKIMSYDELTNITQKVDVIEDSIDKTTNEFSNHQLNRLSLKKCTPENSVIFTKTLLDFERIGDHGLNIAICFKKVKSILFEMKMAD
jgi:phosphate:Na+ symporter